MNFKQYYEEIKNNTKSKKLVFTPDGRHHYVYRLSKNGKIHYYGSRSSKHLPKEDLGVYYFTSGCLKEDFKHHPEKFTIKILRDFDNPAEKMIYEAFLHSKLDVKNNKMFANKSNQTPWGFDTTSLSFNKNTTVYVKDGVYRRFITKEQPTGWVAANKSKSLITDGKSCIMWDFKTALPDGFTSLFKDTIPVRITNNEIIRVNKNDPRYLSGELKAMQKGKKWVHKNPRKQKTCHCCGVVMDSTSITRYHNNNCKKNKPSNFNGK